MTSPDFPAMTRMLLHVEFSDGTVREYEAEHPQKPEFTITTPLPDPFPMATSVPQLIPEGTEAASVALSFRASRDPRCPIMMRTYSTVDRGANFRRLVRVRELAASLGDRSGPIDARPAGLSPRDAGGYSDRRLMEPVKRMLLAILDE
jgi:hypothetical protein